MTRNTLDGFELFKSIGTHRDVFAGAEDKIEKAAQMIVLSHIKATDASIASLGGLLAAIGPHYFSIALDYFGTADLKKVLKKIDPHFALAPAVPDVQLRQHIHRLAERKAAPIEKPATAPKATKKIKQSVAKHAAEWPAAMSPPVRKAS